MKQILAHVIYVAGKMLGTFASRRPDVVHRFLIGVRDGLEKEKLVHYGFGDILWTLWRHWYHGLGHDVGDSPPIPFKEQNARGSGKGTV